MPIFGSSKKKGSDNRGDGTIRKDVNYFVKRDEVTFKLGELDLTFEKFYVLINGEGLLLKIPKEVPMNLINILDTVHDEVGVNRKHVLDSDDVDMVLQLDPDIFNALKERMLKCRVPKDIFDLDIEGFKFVKELEHYHLIEYGTTRKRLNFHLGGKLGNAIRRKGMF